MSVLVVGSVAYDSVKTPFGEVDKALGGSATFFSAAASFLTDTQIVAVVGEDFDISDLDFLRERGVDLSGLDVVAGETFRWKGHYGYDLNEAKTLSTELNVFETFDPKLSEKQRKAEFVFLANILPELQLSVLDQVESPKFTVVDTMNLWIDTKAVELGEVLSRADMVVINESEARQLAGEANTFRAIERIREMGPKFVVVKRGEYGALLSAHGNHFFAPAFPLESVFDPTGAGDTFGGGLVGTIARNGRFDEATLRQGVVVGSVLASFAVEKFSLDRMRTLKWSEVVARYQKMQALTRFDTLTIE